MDSRTALGADGPVAGLLAGFLPRETQQELSEQIELAIDQEHDLVADERFPNVTFVNGDPQSVGTGGDESIRGGGDREEVALDIVRVDVESAVTEPQGVFHGTP